MKCVKLWNSLSIQAYSIKSPSKKIKKLFPKKYTVVRSVFREPADGHISNNGGYSNDLFVTEVMNVSKITDEIMYDTRGMFIFTYNAKLPKMCLKWFKTFEEMCRTGDELRKELMDIGTVHPWSLLDYIYNRTVSTEKKGQETVHTVNAVLRVIPGLSEVPAVFCEEMIIRCNSEEMLGRGVNVKGKLKQVSGMNEDVLSSNFRKNVLKIMTGWFKDTLKDFDTERFLLKVFYEGAWNDFGFPIVFPKMICNKSMVEDLKMLYADNAFMIGYDIAADSPEMENDFINAVDNAFENLDLKVVVFQNYSRMVDRVMEEFKKMKCKYKIVKKFAEEVLAVECRMGDLKKIKGWTVGDMIG